MFYREAGQFKTSYKADQAIFPILQDRIGLGLILAVAVIGVPLLATDGFINSIMIPFLILALAAIGLNILTGYCGQLSLGTGAFMGVGAYSCYKLATIFPEVSILVHILLAGFFSAAIGVLFGLPSLRIKGLYLAITTLAAQFFLGWLFVRWKWLYNYNESGAIQNVPQQLFGVQVTGAASDPITRYLIVLAIVAGLTWVASNIIRGRIGRSWMMIRDMDIAAELMGIKPLNAKLSAFAVSSYFCGVAGAMMVFFWLGSAEADVFNINLSFQVLFMVIIGGLGSLIGSFLGAAFIFVLPVVIRTIPRVMGVDIGGATVEHISTMAIGALIVFFLIVEPHGLARLWQIGKEKLRNWPFPYG